MKKTIWKYPLLLVEEQQVSMPDGADILCVQAQHEKPHLWASVNPAAFPTKRTFIINGTGHPISHDGRYIGTFQMNGGCLVFHVFEVTA